MGIPNKPSDINADLALKATWGGTKTTYTNDEITYGHGLGTPLGRQIKSTLLNHDKQYINEWIKHNSDAIDYLAQNTELYIDSGTANAIVLNIASGEPITAYSNGLKLKFFKHLSNTTACTINIEGIGIKSLANVDGTALSFGDLVDEQFYECVYDSINDYFILTNASSLQGRVNTIENNYIKKDGTIEITSPLRYTSAISLNALNLDTMLVNKEYVDSISFTKSTVNMPTMTNGIDADHDINFSAGFCYDLTTNVGITSTAKIKQADVTFVEGTNAGGFVSGESLPTSGLINLWTISKADGTTDFLFNNNAISGLTPTLPTGFVNKRRIATLSTDASANIRGFSQLGDRFYYNIYPSTIITSGTLPTSKTNYTMPIPPNSIAMIQASGLGASATASYVKFFNANESDISIISNYDLFITSTVTTGNRIELLADSSSRISLKSTTSANGLGINIVGYIDNRGIN